MGTRFFSTKDRPFHLGPYPLERLKRVEAVDLAGAPAFRPLDFRRLDTPHSLVNAMGEYQAMMDVLRDGEVNPARASAPTDPAERARHMKAFGYFQDASMMGICRLPETARLQTPFRNPDIDRLAEELRTKQTKTLASGIDEIMAGLKEGISKPPSTIGEHTHCLVFLVEHMRAPSASEPGSDWIEDAQAHRAALRATEAAIVLSNYLHLLGFRAKAHTATSSDVDLGKLAVAAGLATIERGRLFAPYIGEGFGLAAVTTDFDMETDEPLAPWRAQTYGPAWWVGKGTAKSAFNRDPYRKRRYVDGAHPFETLKRVDAPTTFIDEARVARVPKTDRHVRAVAIRRSWQETAEGGLGRLVRPQKCAFLCAAARAWGIRAAAGRRAVTRRNATNKR